MKNKAKSDLLINDIIQALQQNGFAGVNIDFEELNLENDKILVAFQKDLYEKLSALGLKQHEFILNKTLPKKLLEEPALKRLLLRPINEALSFEEQLFLQFLNRNLREEAKLTKLLTTFAPSLHALPLTPDLDSNFQLRMESLCHLGERILRKV